VNIASLVNPPKATVPASRGVALLRVQAVILAHATVGAVKDGLLAFRSMRSVLTQGVLASE
jgi:hypothetical protein